MISLNAEPESWLERISTQLGGFPVFIRPSQEHSKGTRKRYVAHDPEELQIWIKAEFLLVYDFVILKVHSATDILHRNGPITCRKKPSVGHTGST